MTGERVGAHAGQRDAAGGEVGVGLAKLAKLAHSAGSAVEEIEEEHQRLLADKAAESKLGAVACGQGEVGNRMIDEVNERVRGHAAIMVGPCGRGKRTDARLRLDPP